MRRPHPARQPGPDQTRSHAPAGRRSSTPLRIRDDLADALAPTRCALCLELPVTHRRAFCAACERDLPWWRRVDGCPVCGTPAPASDSPSGSVPACGLCLSRGSPLHACLALGRYEGELARLLPAFKRRTRPFGPPVVVARAVDALAAALARLATSRWPDRPDALVGVPLHPLRRLRRGFNHIDPIASRIADELSVPWAPGWLRRRRATPHQVGRLAPARGRNVSGAFVAANEVPYDSRIWLVDDVLTTGSTMEAAADALLEAGALEVRGLSIAATLPRARQRPLRAHQPRDAYVPRPLRDSDRPGMPMGRPSDSTRTARPPLDPALE